MCSQCTDSVAVFTFAAGSVKNNNISYCILILSFLSTLTDIDDCASHPCKNNGTCTDRVNGFNCSCAPGFNGTLCEGNYSQSLSNASWVRISGNLLSRTFTGYDVIVHRVFDRPVTTCKPNQNVL